MSEVADYAGVQPTSALRAYDRKNPPETAKSYLIVTGLVGMVFDIAFYEGVDNAGTPIWILSDVNIDEKNILYYAEVADLENSIALGDCG